MTVTVMLGVTGVDHHGQRLVGIDRQDVGIDIVRTTEKVIERTVVDQAAQRQDRLRPVIVLVPAGIVKLMTKLF